MSQKWIFLQTSVLCLKQSELLNSKVHKTVEHLNAANFVQIVSNFDFSALNIGLKLTFREKFQATASTELKLSQFMPESQL